MNKGTSAPETRASSACLATNIAKYYPAPNAAGNTSNFLALLPSTDNDNKGDIRYDHYLTDKVTFFSRYSYRIYNQLASPLIPGPSGQGAGILSRVMNWQTASGVTWTLSPTSINAAK